MPLSGFLSPSAKNCVPSISSCRRQHRFDAPQSHLFVVGSVLKPRNLFFSLSGTSCCSSLGFTTAKLRIIVEKSIHSEQKSAKISENLALFYINRWRIGDFCVFLQRVLRNTNHICSNSPYELAPQKRE